LLLISCAASLFRGQAGSVSPGHLQGLDAGAVAKDRFTSLRWFTTVCPFADNIMKAAAKLILEDVELKKAG